MFRCLFAQEKSDGFGGEDPLGLISPLGDLAFVANPLYRIRLGRENEQSISRLKSAAPSSIACLAVNCQAKFLATGSDNSLTILDPLRDVPIRTLLGHDAAVGDVAWHSTQPSLLSSVGGDATLRTWDVRSHPAQVFQPRRVQRAFSHLRYSPDSSLIACGGEDRIVLYDIRSSQEMRRINCISPVMYLRFNPEECLLATSHLNNTCNFWDIDTGECVASSPAGQSIHRIEFNPTGECLLVATSIALQIVQWEPFSLSAQHFYSSAKIIGSQCMDGEKFSSLHTLDMMVCGDNLLQLATLGAKTSNASVTLLSTPLRSLATPSAETRNSGETNCYCGQEEAIEPPTAPMFGKLKLEQQRGRPCVRTFSTPLKGLCSGVPQESTSKTVPIPTAKRLNKWQGSADTLEYGSSSSSSTSTPFSRSSSLKTRKKKGACTESKRPEEGKHWRESSPASGFQLKCDDIVRSSARVTESVRRRKAELTPFLNGTSNGPTGAETIVDEGARKTEESHMLATILREYLSSPKSQSISLNSKFLKHLRTLLNHPNNAYVQLALDFLAMVVEQFGESIRHGLLSKQHSIGVDVAAESRYERCARCRNELMQIRLNSAFLVKRMDERQLHIFEGILRQIDSLSV